MRHKGGGSQVFAVRRGAVLHGNAWRGTERLGAARNHKLPRYGTAVPGDAWPGEPWQCAAWKGMGTSQASGVRHGWAMQGIAWSGSERQGTTSFPGTARPGAATHGKSALRLARRGTNKIPWRGLGRLGRVGHRVAWDGSVGLGVSTHGPQGKKKFPRPGQARRCHAGHGKAWAYRFPGLGRVRRGSASSGMTMLGMAGTGTDFRGLACPDMVRQCTARPGRARTTSFRGSVWPCLAGYRLVTQGWAGHDRRGSKASRARYGLATPGMERQGTTRCGKLLQGLFRQDKGTPQASRARCGAARPGMAWRCGERLG